MTTYGSPRRCGVLGCKNLPRKRVILYPGEAAWVCSDHEHGDSNMKTIPNTYEKPGLGRPIPNTDNPAPAPEDGTGPILCTLVATDGSGKSLALQDGDLLTLPGFDGHIVTYRVEVA